MKNTLNSGYVFWFLFILNLGLPFLSYTIPEFRLPIHYGNISDVITYIGILFLIYNNLGDARNYHIDKSVTIYLVLAGLVLIVISITVSLVLTIIFLTSGIFVIKRIYLRLKSASIDLFSASLFKELLLYSIIGGFLGVVIFLISPRFVFDKNQLDHLWIKFIIEFGKSAVNEEILLRGFLWGYLKNKHWNETTILVFQALTFSFGHISYYGNIEISIRIFVTGLLLGIVAWKLRSVTPGIIAHALANTLVYL